MFSNGLVTEGRGAIMNGDGKDRAGLKARERSGTWRQVVISGVARDRAEMTQALKEHGDDPRAKEIRDLLRCAEAAADQPARIRFWWSGSCQTLAYLSLHEAEALIDGLLEGGELTAHAQDLLAKAPTVLKPDDRRVITVRAAVDTPGATPPTSLEPAAVAHLARAVHDASDARYAQSRTFRNRLIRLTLISLGAIGLMLTAFAVNAIPLPVKGIAAPSHIETAALVCLFGAVGAMITAVGPLARATGTWNPFSLPYYQMLLKVALGPLFALIGVMMLASGLIPNVLFPMPLPDLLIWALVFGATQQAVTRVIDNRVNGLVSEKPANARQESPGDGNAPNAADTTPPANTS
jgi:hypothetical protein